MKIAIVRRKFNPFGGAEKFILRTLQSLSLLNIEVTVIAESWTLPSGMQIAENIKTLLVSVTGFSRAAKFHRFNKNVASLLSKHHFDLIQSHERMLGADIYRLGDGVHAAWVKRLQSISPWLTRWWLSIDPYHQAVINTEAAMANDASLHFVANSPLVKLEIMTWYQVPEARVTLIENGIECAAFQPTPPDQKPAYRQALGLNPDLPTIVFIGSGFARKGAYELIKAVSTLENIQLLVVGGDKRINALRSLVKSLKLSDRVLVTGPQLDVKPYLAAADVFCLPSLYDSFPNAALEALCCGLPVIVTEGVGLAETVVAEHAGVLVRREPDDIARGIREALQQLTTMSRNAHALAQRYDMAIAMKKWQALYQTLLDAKSKSTSGNH